MVSEAPEAPIITEIAETRADTNMMTAPITVPTVLKSIAPKPIVAEVNTHTNGQPDTMAVLATLVDATTPTTPTLTRDIGNTYVVRPGNSLASISVKYYESTDAVNDIVWPT